MGPDTGWCTFDHLGSCRKCDKIKGDKLEIEKGGEENVQCTQYEENKEYVKIQGDQLEISGEGDVRCDHYEGDNDRRWDKIPDDQVMLENS